MDRVVFISMPMIGTISDEINNSIGALMQDIAADTQDRCEFLNTRVKEGPPQTQSVDQRIWYLGKSIEILSRANTLVVPKQRDQFPGCQAEALIGKIYGLDVIEYDLKNVRPDLEAVEILSPKYHIFHNLYYGKYYADVKDFLSLSEYEEYSTLFFKKGIDTQELLNMAFNELYKVGKVNCSGLIFKLRGESYYRDPDGWSKMEK